MCIVPGIITIRQQRILLAIEHVVQVRGLEHDDAGAVPLADSQRIVAAGRVWIPTDNRIPLLTIEVQGFIAGQSFSRYSRVHGYRSGNYLNNLSFLDHFLDDRGFLDHFLDFDGLLDDLFNFLDLGLDDLDLDRR